MPHPPAAQRPAADEYAAYYQGYVAHVPDGDVLAALEAGLADALALLQPLPEERALARYAPGKWSVKEVVGHLADSERVFAYRALRIARGDATPLPGYDQDDYVRTGGFDARPLAGLLAEYTHLRRASLSLFQALPAEAWARRGVANGYQVTVRALAWIIAGHERHHLAILRERYL